MVEQGWVLATTLMSPDNRPVIVSRRATIGGNITDLWAQEVPRANRVFGVGYGNDLWRAKDVPADILARNEHAEGAAGLRARAPELAGGIARVAVRSVYDEDGRPAGYMFRRGQGGQAGI